MNRHLRLFLGLTCGLGLFALLDQYWFHLTQMPLLIGSYGATSVILYAAPNLEVARLKNVFWGHALSCGVGLLLKLLLGNAFPHLGPVLSIALATTLMSVCGVLHPPGGAISFIAYQTSFHSLTEMAFFLGGAAMIGPLIFWKTAQWFREKDVKI